MSVRGIANEDPHVTHKSTIVYKFSPRLSVGLGYNARTETTSPLVNWLAISEAKRRPALILGVSSDRIGTPFGQSFYATLSKNLSREIRLPIAPYVGLAYGTYEDRLRPVGGLNIGFSRRVSSLVIFDGVYVHPVLNFTLGRHFVSVNLFRGRYPGVSYSFSF